jgi:ribosomal protein S18 acetylase RimI-like enzyme
VALEVRQLCPEQEKTLSELFDSVSKDGEAHFHPHPLTEEYARKVCQYGGQDLYYVVLDGIEALGYGMLRGWDDGYDVPSLGIVVRAGVRGCRFGEMLMHFLHSAARRRGAKQIRLKVYPENVAALHLYRKLGYEFAAEPEAGQLVGRINL